MTDLFKQLSDEELHKRIKGVKIAVEGHQLWLADADKELHRRVNAAQAERTAACTEHYYIPTNAKWQSVGQVRCQFCGDTKN